MEKKGFLDRAVELIFLEDKTKVYILILFLIGLILRLVAANNLGLSADDSVHAVRPINVMEAGRISEYGQSTVLWYYIQEVFYKIFGTSQIGSRMACAIFSSFLIILMFLFVKQVFKSRKAGLIAAALIAFSPFLIKMTLPEMDVAVMFFVIFSGFFIFKFIESSKKKDLMFATLLLGLAIMIKIYCLFFAFSYFLFLAYHYYKKNESWKKTIKILFVFSASLLIFLVPTLTSNYLLYKDKGYMDLMFTTYFRLGLEKAEKLYSWNAGWEATADIKGFFFGKQKNYGGENAEGINRLPGFIILLIQLIKVDPLIMILGFLSLIFMFRKNKPYFLFFLICILPIFIYLGARIPMIKHFTFISILFIPFASVFVERLSDKIKSRIPKFRLRYLIFLFMLFTLFWLGFGSGGIIPSVYVESAPGKLIDYRINNINPDSVVIVDGRIYRGYIGWMFNDRNYIESSLFNQAVQESQKYGNPISMDVYFVECVIDDCGWGTIKAQPDFNKSMEDFVAWFSNNSKVIKEISGIENNKDYFPLLTKENPSPIYRVYKGQMMLNPSILTIVKSTHDVLMYPVGYDNTFGPMFDDYQTYGLFDRLLDKLAHWIVYITLALSFLTLIFLLYLFIDDE